MRIVMGGHLLDRELARHALRPTIQKLRFAAVAKTAGNSRSFLPSPFRTLQLDSSGCAACATLLLTRWDLKEEKQKPLLLFVSYYDEFHSLQYPLDSFNNNTKKAPESGAGSMKASLSCWSWNDHARDYRSVYTIHYTGASSGASSVLYDRPAVVVSIVYYSPVPLCLALRVARSVRNRTAQRHKRRRDER